MPPYARDHRHGNEAVPAVLTLTSLTVKAGTGVGVARVGGILSIQTGAVATGANTTPTVGFTYTLPAASLAVDGQGVRVRAWGAFANNANGKEVTVSFGAATPVFAAPTTTAGLTAWNAVYEVFRTGAATQNSWAWFQAAGATHTPIAWGSSGAGGTETLSGSVVIAVTGTNGVAAANDIIMHGLLVEYLA